ncbi:MAG: c-type cytochrome [Proteobacteria bacterium]|jgi:cytochrome c|nr:c-type cytochrome [Pseudomonadota bacterium]MBK9251132.1 c-type cytochrome [Pseudomonadota bacterium]MCC6632578.1 c-type cytochrome [Gammaproteobacteria bacterium]
MTFDRPALFRPALLALALGFAAPAAFAANVANGKTIFEQRCGICHAVTKDPGGPVAGPSMVGLIGRKAAAEPSFTMYSPALKKYGVTWNAKTLDEFLTMPMQKVPGTTMPMMLPDAKERADVIAYLASIKKK